MGGRGDFIFFEFVSFLCVCVCHYVCVCVCVCVFTLFHTTLVRFKQPHNSETEQGPEHLCTSISYNFSCRIKAVILPTKLHIVQICLDK